MTAIKMTARKWQKKKTSSIQIINKILYPNKTLPCPLQKHSLTSLHPSQKNKHP
jgi:hypothetical protein